MSQRLKSFSRIYKTNGLHNHYVCNYTYSYPNMHTEKSAGSTYAAKRLSVKLAQFWLAVMEVSMYPNSI